MNSTSGTAPTKAIEPAQTTNSFDAQGISLILDSCARNGVATLKFGDLEVWFGPKADQPPAMMLPDFPQLFGKKASIETQSPSPGDEMPNHDKINEQTLRNEEADLRENQLAELAITDPVAFERMVNDGELQDDEQPSPDTAGE